MVPGTYQVPSIISSHKWRSRQFAFAKPRNSVSTCIQDVPARYSARLVFQEDKFEGVCVDSSHPGHKHAKGLTLVPADLATNPEKLQLHALGIVVTQAP